MINCKCGRVLDGYSEKLPYVTCWCGALYNKDEVGRYVPGNDRATEQANAGELLTFGVELPINNTTHSGSGATAKKPQSPDF